jgi:predicted ferric reductase
MRLTARSLAILGSVSAIVAIWATDQIVPAATVYQAQMRVWLAARAAGFTAYLILTFIVAVGLVLSHPVNKSTWKLSKHIFPWHENLFVFALAFTVVHVVSIVLDPYAGVGLLGAVIPGLSTFRSVPVAIGTLGLYAFLITALTARYTKVLPAGTWLKIHRLSIAVWALAWGHGILAGTDSGSIGWLYVASGLAIVAAAAYRYWAYRKGRPTYASSLPASAGGPVATEPAAAGGSLTAERTTPGGSLAPERPAVSAGGSGQ